MPINVNIILWIFFIFFAKVELDSGFRTKFKVVLDHFITNIHLLPLTFSIFHTNFGGWGIPLFIFSYKMKKFEQIFDRNLSKDTFLELTK